MVTRANTKLAQIPALLLLPEKSLETTISSCATSIAPTELHCPYVNGVPHLMGRGTEETDAQILKLMKKTNS